MPVDLSNPSGYNQWFQDLRDAFRAEAVDDHLDGGNLDPVNEHVTGSVDADTLTSQYSFPVVWSILTSHNTAYATVSTDQGDVQARVVVLAADVDPDVALEKARVLGGRIIDNVEGSALVDDDGNANAARVDLDNFALDARPVGGQGAQVKFSEAQFSIQVERKY